MEYSTSAVQFLRVVFSPDPNPLSRRAGQADALSAAGIKADSFLLLNVPDEMLIARVVGRRLDPETGDIYHLDFNPPPPEIADRYCTELHSIIVIL